MIASSQTALTAARPVSIGGGGVIPRHVAIIMDGNGRWAKARSLPRVAGHREGAESIRRVLEACRSHGVGYLTLYAFSAENWQRPEEEVSELMNLLRLYMNRELKRMHADGVRLRFIGERSRLAADIQRDLAAAEEMTRNNAALHLTVALSYGGRQELAGAARRLAEQAKAGKIDPASITAESVAACLHAPDLPDPDLLIRTGGEERISNFLLWQLAYTELYFTPVLWPDFQETDFAAALADFAGRERRYGGLAAHVA